MQTVSQTLLTELSGLDGGVAVLKSSGRFIRSEGSQTKAATSASRYGIAVKIALDGDITFYEGAKIILELCINRCDP